ncbi:hypothetical protein PIB30_061852 [Stylosanthes scabra]|uniref:Reverse transcriptase domain-containing protein n=1 Tax=Stylosanthes scabra TaxID=79078 RepID=A0ABU6UK08_9FABA|nr:hypothetical protein [Stylosanthes scabra]
MPGKLRSRWEGPYKVKDISPYGTIELEHESSKITFKVNGHRVKLYHEQHIGKEADVYLLRDANDHQGTINDHLVEDNSKWKVLLRDRAVAWVDLRPSSISPRAPQATRSHKPKNMRYGPQPGHAPVSRDRVTMDHKRQCTSKGKEKLIPPPTRASPRLAATKTPHSLTSPISVLQPKKLFVLAIAANTLGSHSKAAGNLHAPTTGGPRTTKVRRTARISVKPIKRNFSTRIASKGAPSKVAPKEADVMDISSDSEKDMRDYEAALELTVMDGTINQEEEEEEDNEEEKEDLEEYPEADILDHFFDTDSDYADYLALDDLDPADSSEGSS